MNNIEQTAPIIVIGGATATGKTAAAVAVAESISGEIISADSMQVYRHMNIGTAKPTTEEMRNVPHHMIDVREPDEDFNVAAYKNMAEDCLRSILERGKTPIITGGTGFYINALIKNTDFSEGAADSEIRAHYEELARLRGKEYLHKLLAEKDPASSAGIHPNNVKRVIRALEYLEVTGCSIASHNAAEKTKIINDSIYYFVLDMERQSLYDRINSRVDIMLENGLLGEVESLLDNGYTRNLVSMQGIGYKELAAYVEGEYGFQDAVDRIKQGTRNYAKRQITWFRHQANGIQVDAEEVAQSPETVVEYIKNEIERRRNAR